MFFKNIKIKYNPFINTVAATCFGVLQIHSNGDTMRKFVWKDIVDPVGAYNEIWMPLHAVISVLGIFFICAGIDLLRIKFIEKPFFNLWDKYVI
jgi:hypothetical protein